MSNHIEPWTRDRLSSSLWRRKVAISDTCTMVGVLHRDGKEWTWEVRVTDNGSVWLYSPDDGKFYSLEGAKRKADEAIQSLVECMYAAGGEA